jgi:uncharacterized protein YkuJ
MIVQLGALKCGSNEYVYPKIANKKYKYECPECNRELILKQGKIRIHHFAHLRTTDTCTYYSRPTESAIHKNAKLLLKHLLCDNTPISIIRPCRCCGKEEEYEIPERDTTSNICLEYRFEYNGVKVADVAFIENTELIGLFEIFHTHKTRTEKRPEPWFELNANDLISHINSSERDIQDRVQLQCIRKEMCDDCIERNKCKGRGECFDNNNFKRKNSDMICDYNCKLRECIRCYRKEPQWLFDTNMNNQFCKLCDIDTWNVIYLHVPYSQKDIAKKLGAKFDYEYTKKWYTTMDNQHMSEIFTYFREIPSPY